ncbi:zinc-dependent alcohol dehydrogenase family protein [Aspergillus saccharolyticus JOP 1030-1]|uniref:Alcohol dehydrogenase n=1 Tax=Aspergillus saccharolyticus JOP 1030-1 TaxID=1450539 RepID=A0A318ZMR8_9EURO|nr:alcohol dehydrogenase [Aspergillus saccharolyticus JOP 1030-1]PYH48796.1 alcohol dehydrogenase [Aspergillus saccharolyticus JOP 1030-1]
MHTSAAWILEGQDGLGSLKLIHDKPAPSLGDYDVLLHIHAASLNHRDLAIAKGAHSLVIKPNVVAASDGAGIVEAVGPLVQSFQPGDRVCTYMVPHQPESEPVTFADIGAGLGQQVDGTLRPHAVYHETALVKMPASLSFVEASTLTCAALTAWNALFGLAARAPKKGDVVLVQGTGGVSVIALQVPGATVIATTSSKAKAQRLQALGAHHVLNYRRNPKWGETARALTPDGKGVHLVVDVGGLSTASQSLKAIRPEGMIAMTGLLGGPPPGENVNTLVDCLMNLCTVRGVLLGTRRQFEEMNRFIEEHGIRPAIDERVFGFAEVREAYEYMEEQKHFSKVCVRVE